MSEEKDIILDEMEDMAPEGTDAESKSEKFKRISAQRIQNASKYIVALGKLAGSSSYEYTEEDINKIFGYLQKQLDDVKAKFEQSIEKTEEFSW